jgi:hypothetical protein
MAGEKHLYVVAGGGYVDSGLAEEEWQVGLRFIGTPGSAPDPLGPLPNSWDVVAQNTARTETLWRIDGNWTVEGGVNDLNVGDWLNNELAPAFTTWMGLNLIHNIVRLDTLKVYPIGAPDGAVIPAPPYSQGSPVTLTWTSSNPVGGGSSSCLPLQNSLVVSHRTAQVGRRGRGRMYFPAISSTGLSSTAGSRARLSSGTIAAAVAGQKALLEAVQVDGSSSGFWVAPAIIGSPWTDYALINQVQAGDVIDTQRRRRNSLTETVQSDTVDNPA